jgi:transposase
VDVDAIATLTERIDALQETVRGLSEQNAQLAEERERYRTLYLQMLELNKKLERGLLGQKAEKLPPDQAQLTLALLATLLGDRPGAESPAEAVQQIGPHTRSKPTGRKPLPENLPRVEIEILPDEVKRGGLDAFVKIGEEVSEVVERRPASLVAVRITRPKFVRADRVANQATRVFVAEPLELPIERGLAGPGLLADTIVRRWQDHLPLNRLESIYAREGLELARSTVCGWHEELAVLARPLVDAMWEDAFLAPYLCTDATGVLVQAKERCRHAHFWVVVAPERHVLYRYSERHDSAAVDRMLAGYQGHLVADAHAVYDHLYADGGVVEVGCWSHCRRYFFKALGSEPERAREALAYIRGLFDLERALAEAPRKKRETVRAEHSKPLVEGFFQWCEVQQEQVLDDTPIAKAVRYALNQRQALCRFLEDGRLPLHNNGSELQLRRQAIGRKNWLFLGSDQGAEANTTFVSLLASCQMHGTEPWGYLRDLLCLLPRWKQHHVLELAPRYWNQTLQQEHTQQLLAANPFRQVTLGQLG